VIGVRGRNGHCGMMQASESDRRLGEARLANARADGTDRVVRYEVKRWSRCGGGNGWSDVKDGCCIGSASFRIGMKAVAGET
jgi:hypothetical protein